MDFEFHYMLLVGKLMLLYFLKHFIAWFWYECKGCASTNIGSKSPKFGCRKVKQGRGSKNAMGGTGGQDYKLESSHALCGKSLQPKLEHRKLVKVFVQKWLFLRF